MNLEVCDVCLDDRFPIFFANEAGNLSAKKTTTY